MIAIEILPIHGQNIMWKGNGSFLYTKIKERNYTDYSCKIIHV